MPLLEQILFVAMAFLSKFLGGMLALRFYKKSFEFITAFTAGVLIAAAFFDMLPEAISLAPGAVPQIMLFIVFGFGAFYVLEKFIVFHACPESECHSHRHGHIGIVGAGGLAFHSFLDGLAIGFGFALGSAIGLVIALAVVMHSFGDGISIVLLMLRHNNPRKRTLMLLALGSVAPALGALCAFWLRAPASVLSLFLAFFTGFFIYIGASDLLPEAHRENKSIAITISTIAGIALVYALTALMGA